MPRSAEALIKPELLVWARESAGMEISFAAKKLNVSEDKILDWESGSKHPTIKQLRKAAKVYKQSFAAFYLSEPPKTFRPPVKDYRRLPGSLMHEFSSDIIMDIRSALDKREICLELFSEKKESIPEFNLKTSIEDNPESLADKMRTFLDVSIQAQNSWRNKRVAFNKWREAIESVGILVFQSTKINLSEMRGYSLCEFPLPVIVVNRKDSYSARSFTMLHELVHLMLHSSGICDLKTRRDAKPEDQKAEVYCNHVAGASLVPEKKLTHEPLVKQNTTQNWPDESLDELAIKYSVSKEVILRRLLILSRTNETFYKMKRKQYQSEFKKKETSGFVPPSINVISASGKTFVRLVLDSFYSNRITFSDVSEYLGVKLKHFDEISHKLGIG